MINSIWKNKLTKKQEKTMKNKNNFSKYERIKIKAEKLLSNKGKLPTQKLQSLYQLASKYEKLK